MNTTQIKLLLEISNADSLQQIVNLGYDLLGNPIFIDDMHRNILAYTNTVEIDNSDWKTNIVENIHDESLTSKVASKQLYTHSMASRHPVYLDDLDIPARYGMTLTHNGIPLGNVTITSFMKPFEDGDCDLFELFCQHVVSVMLNSKYSFQQTQAVAVNTIIRLLNGEALSRSAVESKLSIPLGNGKPFSYLYLISDQTGDVFSLPYNEIITKLSSISGSIAFLYEKYIVCILTCSAEQANSHKAEIAELFRKYNLYAFKSNSFFDIMKLRQAYQQAQKIASHETLSPKKHVYSYNDIAIFDMFDVIAKHANLLDYCEEHFLLLYEYDKTHNTNLLNTLKVYLESCLQYEQTAKKLFVHKNTVRYRIAKCQEILNEDFSDGTRFYRYSLSLKILEYLHRI